MLNLRLPTFDTDLMAKEIYKSATQSPTINEAVDTSFDTATPFSSREIRLLQLIVKLKKRLNDWELAASHKMKLQKSIKDKNTGPKHQPGISKETGLAKKARDYR